MRRMAVFLFADAEELDWAGPWEVLSVWAHRWPGDEVEVFTLAQTDGPVTCAKGLVVIPHYSWQSAPDFDVLVYPGGMGTRPQLENPEVLGWVKAQAERGAILASVCTGSLVLAKAGLLDGKPATTHFLSLDLLRSLGRDIDVRAADRFVDSGQIITAAGVSAGIDMALHLVARLHSPERARAVKQHIQYEPAPPV